MTLAPTCSASFPAPPHAQSNQNQLVLLNRSAPQPHPRALPCIYCPAQILFLGDAGVGKASLVGALRPHAHKSGGLREVGSSGGSLLSNLREELANSSSSSSGSEGVGLSTSASFAKLCDEARLTTSAVAAAARGQRPTAAGVDATGATGVRRHVVIVWTSQLADTMKSYAMRHKAAAVALAGANVPVVVVCNMADIAPCPLPEMNAMRGTKMPALAVSAARGTNVGALWLLIERSVSAAPTPPASPRPARHDLSAGLSEAAQAREATRAAAATPRPLSLTPPTAMPGSSSTGSLASAASTEQGSGSPHSTRPPSLEPPTPATENSLARPTPPRRLNSGPSLNVSLEPMLECSSPARLVEPNETEDLARTAPADSRPRRRELSGDTLGCES